MFNAVIGYILNMHTPVEDILNIVANADPYLLINLQSQMDQLLAHHQADQSNAPRRRNRGPPRN
uniref:Uncharacterized protein n=1 Tax=Meloidogyne enterolobii TaxID=390850 RepID=A0A6V7V5W0_MELEN|nr:unnamed protein product [Meloidogyne enterolobii]